MINDVHDKRIFMLNNLSINPTMTEIYKVHVLIKKYADFLNNQLLSN